MINRKKNNEKIYKNYLQALIGLAMVEQVKNNEENTKEGKSRLRKYSQVLFWNRERNPWLLSTLATGPRSGTSWRRLGMLLWILSSSLSYIYLSMILLFISSHDSLRGIHPLYSSPSIHPTFCSEAPSAPMSTCQQGKPCKQCKPCRQCTPCQQCQRCQQFIARCYFHLWWYFYYDYHYHWDKLQEASYVVAMCNHILHFESIWYRRLARGLENTMITARVNDHANFL